MSLTSVRWVAAIVLFVVTLLVGTVPAYLFQLWTRRHSTAMTSERKKTILSDNIYVQIVTQLGGGILFFTVLVHMIPEIRSDFEEYLKTNRSVFAKSGEEPSIGDLDYPYLELAISCGFFGVFLAEVLMHLLLDRHGFHENSKDICDLDKKSEISNIESETSCAQNAKDNEPVVIPIRDQTTNIEKEEPLYARFLHGLVIIFAFSIHSIFDGIAIGVKTETHEIWTMFIAISSHKLMIALIISVELYEKCANFAVVVIHMTLFSIMSPIGIITVILTDTDSEVKLSVIILSAVASGTLLYIVFFEILQKERVSKLKPIIQFVAMIVGFGIMFCITTTLRED